MANLIKKAVSFFEPEIKYTSSKALEMLTKKLRKDSISLEAARILSEKSDLLSLKSFDHVKGKFQNRIFIKPADKNKFVGDISHFIKLISYCLIANNSEPINLSINKIKSELELPIDFYIEAINYVKDNHQLNSETASEANLYIDYLLDILS